MAGRAGLYGQDYFVVGDYVKDASNRIGQIIGWALKGHNGPQKLAIVKRQGETQTHDYWCGWLKRCTEDGTTIEDPPEFVGSIGVNRHVNDQ